MPVSPKGPKKAAKADDAIRDANTYFAGLRAK
jgi:hypothetical protein